ncbi:Heme sensor protein HssS [Paenibacillus plantiphilus]|uniref:Heme sensor protein HssS n=1 Tax=Paenibacillus plantiphilus TaxID=2905650 RepID=A0ABM9C1S2_9BACL|nr:HAMP domain-containing sensor histidine kinase [Paenibacillus plantiphilus]CAH1200441.1 Heme sensor protein HssS [Paenibacillus plantiphilus]
MTTLYRQFIAAALFILMVSTIIGLIIANFFYLNVTKENTDKHQVAIAQETVNVLQQVHQSNSGFNSYLHSVAKLGYQIYVINENGEQFFFGEPFEDATLPEEALRVITHGEIYHGINNFSNNTFMMGHFANELKNTVGVPFSYEQQQYGLFIRPDIKLISTDIHTVLIVFILVIAIVNVLGMLWLAKKITRPITQLTEATKQIAKENYSYPLNIKRKDEIGQLSASFNLMQTQLAHNDLARITFINNVSHDFQSPLMNIQGYAELLKSASIKEEERYEFAGIIEKETKRLSNLTKQLLILTSLDQAAYPMKYKNFHLDAQLKEVIKKYRWRIEEGNLEISYKLPATTIRGDEELLAIVWDNLLTNAIKYNHAGGNIEISLLSEGNCIGVVFKDTGIGIEPDNMPQLFDKFFRVDSSRTKEGTGLGLSIVQQIVHLHHGQIDIASTSGKGSIFTIILPRPNNDTAALQSSSNQNMR